MIKLRLHRDFVIPAQAGIHEFDWKVGWQQRWIPAFAGKTEGEKDFDLNAER
jgi:hypothetical protein